MPEAVWNGIVLARSDRTKTVEGNHYFPPEDVRRDYLRESDAHSVCRWKGTASYYDVVIGEERLEQAAWYYPDPKDAAVDIKGYVAFWKGVEVRG